MISRRGIVASIGALSCMAIARPGNAAVPPISQEQHEKYMRLAIAEARHARNIPNGSVIVTPATGEVRARGINNTDDSPLLHGQLACMIDYMQRNGNRDWQSQVLYTVSEPCTMCMSALVLAGIGGVVYGSSSEETRRAGVENPRIGAKDIVDASPFYHGFLVGGVLSADTTRLFLDRKKN